MVEVSRDLHPRFRGSIVDAGDALFIDPDGHEFRVGEIGRQELANLAVRMNGSASIAQLEAESGPRLRSVFGAVVSEMDQAELFDDAATPDVVSGLEFLLELEELADELTSASIYKNPFWQACLDARGPGDVPINVIYGMAIENWQFLLRESYFDAPVLSYVPNSAVRKAMNAFFAEEFGHDEILLRAIETIGVTREDLHDSIPLPQTLGLCNALAYWSLNDPLFFFTTLGLLEGQGLKSDSFLDACERMEIDPAFLAPLRLHSNINIGAGHGNLTRIIFSNVGFVDREARKRLRAQTHLFVGLYNAFYQGVWDHYSRSPTLLRRVSEL